MPGQLNPAPEPLLLNGKKEYLLNDILDSRGTGRRNRLQYRVAWSGYPPDPTWYNIDSEEFTNAQDLVTVFHKKYPKSDRPGKPKMVFRTNRAQSITNHPSLMLSTNHPISANLAPVDLKYLQCLSVPACLFDILPYALLGKWPSTLPSGQKPVRRISRPFCDNFTFVYYQLISTPSLFPMHPKPLKPIRRRVFPTTDFGTRLKNFNGQEVLNLFLKGPIASRCLVPVPKHR